MSSGESTVENARLAAEAKGEENWKRWGTYLPERQWGTVREDYSQDGDCWGYISHEKARSRAYRWGEDGLLGFTDRQCRLCFAPAFWNGEDPILKERLYGLTNGQGNHGEDVKEKYFYVRATPTHSYAKAIYKYPQTAFPYSEVTKARGIEEAEFKLSDTGVFDDGHYFDISIEYAKAAPEDILIRLTAVNRSDRPAPLHVLPQVWFRNTWSWNAKHQSGSAIPEIAQRGDNGLALSRETLGDFTFEIDPPEGGRFEGFLFTENVSNYARAGTAQTADKYFKDAFHDHVVDGAEGVLREDGRGTKAAAHCVFDAVPPGGEVSIRLRLRENSVAGTDAFADFDERFAECVTDSDDYYAALCPEGLEGDAREVWEQAYAGLLWTKQFYHYNVDHWIGGDPGSPVQRRDPRNRDWGHLFSRDVLSMPDKWEYPWFAAWDLAFHMVPFAKVDPAFSKKQLVLLLREWYLHPNGQIPAYEFAFDDTNPPVHAWAAWRVYQIDGGWDREFLARVFQKLLLNFTWWVNRKDEDGENVFAGGFLGLDNIGPFNRSGEVPGGAKLQQADGTAWMAFYCCCMLRMALELAYDGDREEESERVRLPYEDLASKFLEHFVQIVDAMNAHGGTGMWNEMEGFYYDQLKNGNQSRELRVRSLVGLLPMIAVEVLDGAEIERLPGFAKRFHWFRENRTDLSRHIVGREADGDQRWLLSVVSESRLRRLLRAMLDEDEFLSDHGIRSVSKAHAEKPFEIELGGTTYSVPYTPGVSETSDFGGNSNWRGPVWFPINHLLIEALRGHFRFYGESLLAECPRGSGEHLTLDQVARVLTERLTGLFLPDANGSRPCHAGHEIFENRDDWRELLLFHEYFHGDTGKGLGAAHQTGWTALVATHLEDLAEG